MNAVSEELSMRAYEEKPQRPDTDEGLVTTAGPRAATFVSWRDWLWVLAPPLALACLIAAFFRGPFYDALFVIDGHEVMQLISVVYLGGFVLVLMAMTRFLAEAALLSAWGAALDVQARQRVLDEWRTHAWTAPLLRALDARSASVAERQAWLDGEVAALRERVGARMTVPNYLAGMLVGLGLIGTFVGLIATLSDLGGLFEALTAASRQDVNPTELFANMVRRMQEPMRGMGTAFVSSLFGLVASLVLGLSALAAARTGGRLWQRVADMVRQIEARRAQVQMEQATAVAERERETLLLELKLRAQEWRQLLDDLLHMQDRQEQQAAMLRGEIADIANGSRTLANALRERLRRDRAPGRLRLRGERETLSSRARRCWSPGMDMPDDSTQTLLLQWRRLAQDQNESLVAELGRISQEQTSLMWGMSRNLEHLAELLDSTLSRQLSLTLTVDPARRHDG
jgi:hypothetical protein